MVKHLLVVQWVMGLIPHGGPIKLLFRPVLHDWYNKGYMCYPVCGMVHIKDSLLLLGKNSPCSSGSRFPLSLSGPLPYIWCHTTMNKMC